MVNFSDQINEWLTRLNVTQLNALSVIFTGQIYPIDRPPPNETELRAAQRGIEALRKARTIYGIHNSLTPSWQILPYHIDTFTWSWYQRVMCDFLEEVIASPQERQPLPLYIHCSVYFPANVSLQSVNRYQIYLMFLRNTPTDLYKCVQTFRFRLYFIATSLVQTVFNLINLHTTMNGQNHFTMMLSLNNTNIE